MLKGILYYSGKRTGPGVLAVSTTSLGMMFWPQLLHLENGNIISPCRVTVGSQITDISCFIALCFTALNIYCVFYKLKVCGNLTLSKSIGAIFPIASAHSVSLCHVYGNSHNISGVFILIIFVMVICDH